MANTTTQEIAWLAEVEEHDYPAAESYLRLIHSDENVAEVVAAFRKAQLVHFKAKDIFRASQLSLLGVSNQCVERGRQTIREGN
jgi:hypothetical protein